MISEAHEACENWLSLRASQDVEKAIAAVTLKEIHSDDFNHEGYV